MSGLAVKGVTTMFLQPETVERDQNRDRKMTRDFMLVLFVHFRKQIAGFGGLIQGQIYNPE